MTGLDLVVTMNLKPKLKAYGLVRDAHGKPRVDDPSALPDQIVAMLTESERKELGLWP